MYACQFLFPQVSKVVLLSYAAHIFWFLCVQVLAALADTALGIISHAGGDPLAGDAASIEAGIRQLLGGSSSGTGSGSSSGSGGGGASSSGGGGGGIAAKLQRAPVLGGPSPAAAALLSKVLSFMQEHVYPNEEVFEAYHTSSER